MFRTLISIFAFCLLTCLSATASEAELCSEKHVLARMIGTPPFSGNFPQTKVFSAKETPTWIQIPAWLAGTWKADSQVIVRGYDYRQRKVVICDPIGVPIRRRSVIGTQRDDAGQIWHFVGTPYVRTVVGSRCIERQLIEEIRVTSQSSEEVIFQTFATVSQIDKSTFELIKVFREETVTTYRPLKRNLIQVSFLIIDYDLSGKPMTASSSYSNERRVKQFTRIDRDERGDLRKMFLDYKRARCL